MSKLAIYGGKPEVVGFIPAFNTIGEQEWRNVYDLIQGRPAVTENGRVVRGAPLSGFLGGQQSGGYWVRELEHQWAGVMGVKHAVAVNSATSGLLIAAQAVGLRPGEEFAVSPYTMSATVAAPMFTGATPLFVDIEPETFCFGWGNEFRFPNVKATIVTNLFGHPAALKYNRGQSDAETFMRGGKTFYMIEDNAQSPFAMEGEKYAGTIGHIGVFSLNVHKHLQCGEGGICVTNDDELAHKMRMFRNHGEMAGGPTGLNLRMTEVTAAIALSQLNRSQEIIAGRVEQAEAIIKAVGELPGLRPPVVREGCTHVFYTIPWLFSDDRSFLVRAIQAEGVPLQAGYQEPLYRLPAFAKYSRDCPVAERLWSRELLMFENCAYSPSKEQIAQIGAAFHKVIEHMEKHK